MARRTIIVSDYDGDTKLDENDAVKVTLTVKVGDEAGKKYDLDFSQEHIEEFLANLERGRIIPPSKPSSTTGKEKHERKLSEPQQWLKDNNARAKVIKWAAENDKNASQRGLLANDLINEYREANNIPIPSE